MMSSWSGLTTPSSASVIVRMVARSTPARPAATVTRSLPATAPAISPKASPLTVVATAGPFRVTSPNTAVTAGAGTPLNVTWNVANTNVAPISTSAVSILLSLDGGYTYPVTLAANTANDGAEIVTLPAGVQTTRARIKVAAVNNIYFDISDANFTIN